MSYSPHLRTAVLLSGSGTGGAYHAGALRALHEAGVKIDVMSGRGVGVVGAIFAAIDAAPRTWEEGGVWRRRRPPRLYQWRSVLQWAGLTALAGVAILAIPLLVLATGLIAYPLSFLLQMVSVDAGNRVATGYADLIRLAFGANALPTVVPRLVTLCIAVSFGVLAVAAIRQPKNAGSTGHRDRGQWWARLIGAPWTAAPGMSHVRASLWQLFRGPAAAKMPSDGELSRRYSELLFENLGHPGFRELIVATLDLETRGDLIFAAIADARRQAFFKRGRGDLIDLQGIGRSQMLDAVAGALALPVLTEPHLVTFSPESYWKGETHRTCDRIAVVARLFEELVAGGVEQVILVCPDSERATPHQLSKPLGSLHARVAEQLAASETAAVRDVVAGNRRRFKGLFVIQPAHNPIAPLDFHGAYDERSDRYQRLDELIDRGYQDAYRQFIDPVVGGSA